MKTGVPFLARMAARNVLRNWRHSLASLLSLVTGFLAMTLFAGFLRDVLHQYDTTFPTRGMLGSLVVQKKGAAEKIREDVWKYSLDEKEQGVIEEFLQMHAGQVRTRVRFLELSGLVGNGKQSSIFVGFGLDVAEGRKMRGPDWEWNTVTGRPLQAGDGSHVVLGQTLGSLLGCETKAKEPFEKPDGNGYFAIERPFSCPTDLRFSLQSTTESAQANLVQVEPVGFMDAGIRELDNKYVVMPLNLAWELTDSKKVSRYTIEVAPAIDPDLFASQLANYAKERGVEIDALHWKKHPFGELYRRTTTILGIFRTFVLSLVVTIAVMAVFNSILKSVTERTREIGTLRSLGFLQKEIILLFSLEGLSLAALASVVGCLLALVFSLSLNALHIKYNIGIISQDIPLRLALVPDQYLLASAVLCFVSFFAGALPARRAARKNIPEALSSP
jgi:putative ABC transport system permease protein